MVVSDPLGHVYATDFLCICLSLVSSKLLSFLLCIAFLLDLTSVTCCFLSLSRGQERNTSFLMVFYSPSFFLSLFFSSFWVLVSNYHLPSGQSGDMTSPSSTLSSDSPPPLSLSLPFSTSRASLPPTNPCEYPRLP